MENAQDSAKIARSSPPWPPSRFLFLCLPPLSDRLALLHLSAEPHRSVAVVEGVGIVRMHGKDIVLQEVLELGFLHSDDSTSLIGSDAPVCDQVPKEGVVDGKIQV